MAVGASVPTVDDAGNLAATAHEADQELSGAVADPEQPLIEAAATDIVLDSEPQSTTAAVADAAEQTPAGGAAADVGRVLVASYDPAALAPKLDEDQQLPAQTMALQHVFSVDASKRNNLFYIEDDVVLTSAGNELVLLQLPSLSQRTLTCPDGGGIGAIAVHPSRGYIAIAGKRRFGAPGIYVYEYPSLKLCKVLRNGTERTFSALVFNSDGSMLASVGSYPDYMLSLWDWSSEGLVLRSKAFSQEVYAVRFSPFFAGSLTTCGTGHIRFWKMASTFTGLKLQGLLGKFGGVELEDISAFLELPNGNVLSGSEGGSMLLWEGGFIKVVFMRKGGSTRCHQGSIDVLLHDAASNMALTAGSDGYVRLWSFTAISSAEPPEDSNTVVLQPMAEILIAAGCSIRCLLWERGHWLLLDATGALYKVVLPAKLTDAASYIITRILSFQAAPAVSLATCANRHVSWTADSAGAVHSFDLQSRTHLHSRRFCAPALCMTPLPATADSSCSTLLLGFQDGVVRAVRCCSDGWNLLAAFKPHKGPVTCVAVSPDGKQLATASCDGTVFFFSVASPSEYGPLLFTRSPKGVSALCWSTDSTTVLLGFRCGQVLELTAPQGTVDCTRTYEHVLRSRQVHIRLPATAALDSFDARTYGAASPVAAAETGGGDATAAEASQAEVPEAEVEASVADVAAGSLGVAEASSLGPSAQEQGQPKSEPSSGDDSGCPVLWLAFANDQPSSFLVSMGGSAAGAVWRCRLDDDDSSSAQELVTIGSATADGATAAISYFGYSRDGNLALFGTTDGRVRAQPTDVPYGTPSGRYWEGTLHDMQLGSITGVVLSHDGSCLISAARDGTLYALTNNLQPPQDLPAAPLPTLAEAQAQAQSGPCMDITDSQQHCIEDDKQRAEQDSLLAVAEVKKLSVKQRLDAIRCQFEQLRAQDAAKPPAAQLPSAAFEVDPGLRESEEAATATREDEARKQLAFETAKRRLALGKLRTFFFGDVETERIALHAFEVSEAVAGGDADPAGGCSRRVTSFRVARLSDAVQAELAEMEAERQLVAGADNADVDNNPLLNTARAAATHLDTADAALNGGTAAPPLSSRSGILGATAVGGSSPRFGAVASTARSIGSAAATAQGTSRAVSKGEQRRVVKKAREAEWAAFNATRPDDSNDNPVDIAAIRDAEESIGDFKLKSDPNFVLPEAERMTPQKKKRRMVLLLADMHRLKADFNDRFLALRQRKRDIVRELERHDARLTEIGDTLGEPHTPLRAAMRPEEEPELREQVTEGDIRSFAEGKAAAQLKATANQNAFASGGFSGGNNRPAGAAGGTAGHGTAAAGGRSGHGAPSVEQSPIVAVSPAVPLSELEQLEQQIVRRRLQNERSTITATIHALLSGFNSELGALRTEKLRLHAGVKTAEASLLVMYQELQMLKECEVRESVLLAKRQAKLDDRAELAGKIADCQSALEQKRLELETASARRAAAVQEFEVVAADAEQFRDALGKIFFRKIKRNRKKPGAGPEDEDDEELSDSEGDGEDESSDDDDTGGEEMCPPGCEQAVYEKVCEVRERRLDEDDTIAELGRNQETLRKDKEGLNKKLKVVEQGLAAINQEIIEFQKDKQGRLNQIKTTVHLRLQQVQYLVDGRLLPRDLTSALVIGSDDITRLYHRITELDQDRASLKVQQAELRAGHVQLRREAGAKEARLGELRARAHDVQMLKFGQIIDLELLDRIGASRGTEDLKEQLAKQEKQHVKELADWEARIAAKGDELLALTRQNTECLNTVSSLTKTQRGLEGSLRTAKPSLFTDPLAKQRTAVQERDALVQLANVQAREIEKLRKQLAMLRRKDANVYA